MMEGDIEMLFSLSAVVSPFKAVGGWRSGGAAWGACSLEG